MKTGAKTPTTVVTQLIATWKRRKRDGRKQEWISRLCWIDGVSACDPAAGKFAWHGLKVDKRIVFGARTAHVTYGRIESSPEDEAAD